MIANVLSRVPYNGVMKRVSTAQLKDNLEAYLRAVQNGERVVVCEQDRAVAELVRRSEPGTAASDFGDDIKAPRKGDFISPARGPMPRLEELLPPAPLTSVDVVAALRESRDQR